MSEAAPTPLPSTAREIAAIAARMGLPVPDPCMPGVIASLALLGRHLAILRDHGGKPG